MKRTLILVALFLLSAGLYAQNASVKFQDISVEGSKQEMMQTDSLSTPRIWNRLVL